MTKFICKDCGKSKEEQDFPADRTRPTGRHPYCLECKRRRNNISAARNRESNRKRSATWYREEIAHVRAYYQRPDIKVRRKKYMREWFSAHPDYHRQNYRKNRARIRKLANASALRRWRTNVNCRLAKILRGRLRSALLATGAVKTGSAVANLGCSIPELRKWLETKFLSGMSWSNWSRDGWHIDHIKPLSSFDLSDPAQLLLAVNYKNLQPLWSQDNRRKGAKVA